MAVDSTNGNIYATWSNASDTGTNACFSFSADEGASWSTPVTVNTAPANTAIFPWVAAHAGTVDVVYYGAAGANMAGAMWNVYMAQTTNNGASFSQSLVNVNPNHLGVICTEGTACAPGTRTLLDLFQVGIDPLNGLAAIVYVDDNADHGQRWKSATPDGLGTTAIIRFTSAAPTPPGRSRCARPSAPATPCSRSCWMFGPTPTVRRCREQFEAVFEVGGPALHPRANA